MSISIKIRIANKFLFNAVQFNTECTLRPNASNLKTRIYLLTRPLHSYQKEPHFLEQATHQSVKHNKSHIPPGIGHLTGFTHLFITSCDMLLFLLVHIVPPTPCHHYHYCRPHQCLPHILPKVISKSRVHQHSSISSTYRAGLLQGAPRAHCMFVSPPPPPPLVLLNNLLSNPTLVVAVLEGLLVRNNTKSIITVLHTTTSGRCLARWHCNSTKIPSAQTMIKLRCCCCR